MEIDLELQHPSHHRSLPLQDVKEPQLFREQFPYTSICRTEFDDVVLAPHPADQLCITDTTFRDGQQARPPYTVSQVAKIFDFLHRLGGKTGLITASEFFMYSERDRRCIDACRARGYRFPRITGWIRANKNDLQLARDMEFSEVGMLTSVSDYHIFLKLGKTRKQAFDMYVDLVSQALEWGIIPRCHFEDITRADFYGFVLPFAEQLMDLSAESGIPIKIRACDTMGYGVSYPGAALPRSVPGIVYGLHHYAQVPSSQLEWHGHNDFYKVVSNAGTAWLYGCSSVNCSLLGIGERTGNCPLEAMAIEYEALRGTTDGMDLTAVTEIAEFMEREIGLEISPRQPFVGRHFNVTRAGIHADGLLKDEEIYNIFDTAAILNRPATVAVDAHSGLAGIAHWMNSYFRLKGKHQVDKQDALVVAVKEMVDDLYESGRNTVMGDEELEIMVRDADPERYERLLFHKSR